MEQANPSFSNPFSDDSADSNSSDASDLERPNAFFGHRDTLARLYEADLSDSDSGDGSYTPTQLGLSLFRNHQLAIHRDTLARLHFKQNSSKALPSHILRKIASYVDPVDRKNMRLTCRQWAEHIPRTKPNVAQGLPAEILLTLYDCLLPSDYDAARHTCMNWFMVGLDDKIAKHMLSTSGSYPAYLQDLVEERQKLLSSNLQLPPPAQHDGDTADALIDKEWLMSKRLATESRLSSS